MKKTLSIILLCLILLVSCTSKNTENNYKTDVEVSSLAQTLFDEVGNSELTVADSQWVALNIPIELSLCEQSAVYISTTGSADLFCVFKASSEDNAEKLYKQSEEYLTNLEANWMTEYLAEELPKIQNANTVKCGLYVTFVIAEQEAQTAAVTAFENALKA